MGIVEILLMCAILPEPFLDGPNFLYISGIIEIIV